MADPIMQCILEQVASGGMSEKGSKEYAQRLEDAKAKAEQNGLAGPEAYEFAITEAAKRMEERAIGKRAQTQALILAVDRAWEAAGQVKDLKAGKFKIVDGRAMGMADIFGEHLFGKGTGSSLAQQHRGNVAALQSILSEALSKMQSRGFGLKQERVLPENTVRALYGADKGPEAKAAAEAWTQAVTWWRDQMQRAGVFVRELEDWRLPQKFDQLAVKSLGEEGFTGTMEQWFRDGKLRLRDWAADGDAYLAPGLGDEKAREIFKRAYDNIVTQGDASLEPGAAKVTTLADRFGRRRAFEWATDDAWLEFNRTMGVGDSQIGELLIKHMDGMARDLATAQVLGPDPDRAANILLQMYRKEGGGRYWANRLEAMYEINSGKAMAPVSQRLALGAQSFRQFLSSAQLGSAILSSTSDFGFTHATAAWNGLEMTKIMGRYVQNLGRNSAESRAQAMKDGLILETGLRGLHDAARDTIDDIVAGKGVGGKTDAVLNGLSKVTGRASEFVIRAQGLAHHTQALRDAIGSEVMSHLGSLASKTFDELGAERHLLETYGMGAKDWDILRKKALNQGFLDPARLAREGEGAERDVATKMLGAIAGVQRMAVPEGNSITRALMLGKTQAGTWEGEALRSLAQYKGFPMGALLMHAFRSLESFADKEGQWYRGQYLANLIVTTTVLGAASLQLKNIAAGKDPEPMTGPHAAKFWTNAAAQGGALGILGDQLKAAFSAQRLDDPARLLTPAAGFALDAKQLAMGRLQDEVNDRDGHQGRQFAKMVRKYTPVASSLVYSRLAFDRLVADTLQKRLDPDSAASFQRIQDVVRKEQMTGYWWRPGSTSPQRAPSANKVFP